MKLCIEKLGPLLKSLNEKVAARRLSKTDINDFETIDPFVTFSVGERIISSV